MSYNRVVIHGNLTRDPELRFTAAGKPIANLGIAINDKRNGQEHTQFFNAVCFDKQAELSAQYLKKGTGVLLEGRLNLRSWQTDAGEKRTAVEIVADRVVFVDRATMSATSGTAGADLPLPASTGDYQAY